MNRTLTIVILLFFVALDARGFDFPAGRSNGLGHAPLLSDATPATLLSYPSATQARSYRGFELGALRHYDLSDLDEFYVVGTGRFGALQIAAGFSQFGESDLYRQSLFKSSVAWHTPHAAAGISFTSAHLSFGGGYGSLRDWSVGACAGGRLDDLQFVLAAENLTRPDFGGISKPLNRLYTALAEIRLSERHAITGSARFEYEKRPRFGLGQHVGLTDAVSFFWGIASEPLTFGGGLDIMHHGVRLTYAGSYHPVLGFTHNVIAAWSGG